MRDGKRQTIALDGVYDIETQDWDKFVLGGFYDGSVYTSFDFNHEDDFVTFLLAREGSYWGHNAGRFDVLWLLSKLAERKLKNVRIYAAGQRIVCVKVGKNLEFRDSAALVPMSLAHAAELGGMTKSETGFDCKCGEDCGGYCQIRRGMSKAKMEVLDHYLEQDCKATLGLLRGIVAYADKHDLDLTGTIGASAWKTASRWCGLDGASWKGADYRFARKAYYGGRTQVFRPRAQMGYRYDINSAYPAALSETSLPYGSRKILRSKRARQAFEDCKPGLYEVSVTVPDCHIPPLPVRAKTRIAYPTGSLCGVWSRIELENAIDNGVTIDGFGRAVVWEESKPALAYFADRIWKLRADAIKAGGKKSALSSWLKLYANSLTGKLAQKPEVESIVMFPSNSDIRFCRAKGDCQDGAFCERAGCCPHRCSGWCRKWLPIDPNNTIWAKPSYRIAECAHIQFAAYLTAAARVKLHKQLVSSKDAGQDAVYCDTDSVFSVSPRTKGIGKGLGQWAYEGVFIDFHAVAPKVYSYLVEDHESDSDELLFKARAKGIPLKKASWGKLTRGEPIANNRGVKTFKTAVKKGTLFSRKSIERVLHADGVHFGDRILSGDVTLPVSSKEIEFR